MSEQAASLSAELTLDVDKAKWAAGAEALKKIEGELRGLAVQAEVARLKSTPAFAALSHSLSGAPARKAPGILAQVAQGFGMIAGAVTSALKVAVPIAAGIGIGVAHTLISWTEETLALAGSLDDLSQKTGLSAEVLQEYGYVAKLGGASTEEFGEAVTKLALTFKHAGEGSKEAVQALKDAGLTTEAIAAAMKGGDGLDAALMEISSRFADMPDGPKKTALAMGVFGKSGAKLIPTLNKGAEGLAELRKEARDLGIVMSNESVAAGDELGDNIDKLKMSVDGLKRQAIAALLPFLKQAVEGSLAWIKANQGLIRQKLAEWAQLLTDGIHRLIEAGQWLYENRDVFLVPLKQIASYIEKGASLIATLRDGIVQLKEAVAPVLAWLADKFGFIADAIGKVGNAIDRVKGAGGGGGTSTAGKVAKGALGAARAAILGPFDALISGNPFGALGGAIGLSDASGVPRSDSIGPMLGGPGGAPVIPAATPMIPAGARASVPDYEGGGVNTFTAQITVHAAPGMSEETVAEIAVRKFGEEWDTKMHRAMGAS